MASIKDYLRWRGDLSFDLVPFSIVDNIVLSALSYVDLADTGVDTEQGASVAEVFTTILNADSGLAERMRSIISIDAETLHLVSNSTRFGGARLHDYRDEVDDGRSLQFSAITWDLSPTLSAVVFRGTDHSLIGWRENFLLGCKVTMAQTRAAAYLERTLIRAAAEGRHVQVCGHSKGGILAAYAACECPGDLIGSIDHVWSDDGPHMAPEIAPRDIVTTLAGRYTHVIPTNSIVGMLFIPHNDPAVVVRSLASGFLQHDLTTWEIDATDLVRANVVSPESILIAKTFSSWLEGIDLATRECFVNELFDVLSAGDPDRIDATLATPAAVSRVMRATSGMSAATKAVARKLFDAAAASIADIATGFMDVVRARLALQFAA